ncbi:MAG: hypothetical protein LUH19_00700, partial [Lachnospiraceae bacterium]|nr:hypothetical protein [Lachnospiraceae bacterium]
MYFFDRKTMYFVWYREDGQARSVGSAQLTVLENVCRIEISVTNCGRVDGEFPCYMLSGPVESLLGMLRLNRGKGSLSMRCGADRVGHAQVPYGKLTGIHIDLKEFGYLEQKWLPLQPYSPKTEAVREIPEHMVSDRMPYRRRENDTEKNIEQLKPQTEINEKAAVIQPTGEQTTEIRDIGEEDIKEPKKQEEKEEEENETPGSVRETQEEKQPVHLYADKWQQLCAIYPIVHPFGDARGYLSIEPRDFVILQERYQVMVQNSFLLHGFYNYRHLLLGRQRGEREMNYYLGVPGVLYEKE